MTAQPDTAVDFRRSLPPVPPDLHTRLAGGFADLADEMDLGMRNYRSIPRGSEADRTAGAAWLAPRFGTAVPPERLVISNGTQSAILILLKRLVGEGGLLVAEKLSYGALRALAGIAGVRVQGLEVDHDGLVPEAFEAACRTARPRALYCNPTVQNPTTAIVPEARRAAIADIARRYEVALIEDEALGHLHPDSPRPLAAFAPELTWYIMTTSKCLSHGLRLAYVLMPASPKANAVWAPVEHLSYWHPAPLLAALVTHWIDTGSATAITEAIAAECRAREQAAREVLSGFRLTSRPGSMHVWLELPDHLPCESFAAAAEQRGVLMRTAHLFAVDDQPTPNAVRLSLSTPGSLDEVRRGLDILRSLLERRQS